MHSECRRHYGPLKRSNSLTCFVSPICCCTALRTPASSATTIPWRVRTSAIPPVNTEEAIAVLREVVESAVNHIDTSDYYGPHVTNQIIKQALHPYPKGLVIVTKL